MIVYLSYLGTFSLNLRKDLYKSVSNLLPPFNIKAIFQSKNWLSSLFKFKKSIPIYLRSHLIFKFLCSNCNITYNNETERHLKVKAYKDIGTSPFTGKRINNNKISSVKGPCLLQVTCIHFMVLPLWIMSHRILNVWLKNLYLLSRINCYWTNKLNH